MCSVTCARGSAAARPGAISPRACARSGRGRGSRDNNKYESGGPMTEINVNGRTHEIDADPSTPLLYALRNDLELNGAKFGCGLGQCGACTVLVDGEAVYSCLVPLAALSSRKVTTVEGLGTLADPGPLQRAFIEEQAAQCGYCIAGMMMRAQALL